MSSLLMDTIMNYFPEEELPGLLLIQIKEIKRRVNQPAKRDDLLEQTISNAFKLHLGEDAYDEMVSNLCSIDETPEIICDMTGKDRCDFAVEYIREFASIPENGGKWEAPHFAWYIEEISMKELSKYPLNFKSVV